MSCGFLFLANVNCAKIKLVAHDDGEWVAGKHALNWSQNKIRLNRKCKISISFLLLEVCVCEIEIQNEGEKSLSNFQ